jgi:hypothetical protein
MRFYQVHLTHDAGTSAGYKYFTTRREAEKARRDWIANDPVQGDPNSEATITQIDIMPTKTSILRALNLYASHEENG